MKKRLAFALTLALSLSLLAGCGGVALENGEGSQHEAGSHSMQAENVMEQYEGNVDKITIYDFNKEAYQTEVTDFAVRLFQQTLEEEENTLISPMSVLVALSMTANGAQNNTKTEMEAVLGLPVETLNPYIGEYLIQLPQGEKYKLTMANSIWFTDDKRFTIVDDFLQKNADYYNAEIYKTDFSSDTALDDINQWVEEKTDGMIKNILDQIPEQIIMYLINALAFEAEWDETYDEGQVRENTFTTENGKSQSVELMYSEESLYLEDENATGFIKYYDDQKYAFVAILPNEGVCVSDYVAGLTGEQVQQLLNHPRQVHVNAAIPVFETEYDILLNNVLQNMGMTDAFDGELADFTGLGTSTAGNINIDRVIHKTYITVGPLGTKAGAATAVEMTDSCAPGYIDSKTVHLDRPFVYMLIDCENNQPFFMGTVMSVED